MILNERFKELRKALGLTQQQLADILNTSRNNIAGYELGNRKPSDAALNNICRELNVNKTWLCDGVGEMFAEADTFSLDDFAKSRGATAQELEILKAYFEIDADTRNNLIEHFINHLMAHSNSSGDGHPDTPEELERLYPPIEDTEMGVS